MKLGLLGAIGAALLTFPLMTAAHAGAPRRVGPGEPPPPPSSSLEQHEGLLIGFSLGGGSIVSSAAAGETTGIGSTTAIGFELVHGHGNFAADVQVRVSHNDFDGAELTNVAVLLGANWY